MKLTFSIAAQADALTLAELHTVVADDLTLRYGRGGWSMRSTEKGVLLGMRHSRVLVARRGQDDRRDFALAHKKAVGD